MVRDGHGRGAEEAVVRASQHAFDIVARKPLSRFQLVGVDRDFVCLSFQDQADHQRRREGPGLTSDVFGAGGVADNAGFLFLSVFQTAAPHRDSFCPNDVLLLIAAVVLRSFETAAVC
mgnify:CR=1 FL=1